MVWLRRWPPRPAVGTYWQSVKQAVGLTGEDACGEEKAQLGQRGALVGGVARALEGDSKEDADEEVHPAESWWNAEYKR